MTSAELLAKAIIHLGPDGVAQAVEIALRRAETWRLALTPRGGEPWDRERSRDLEIADDVVDRLRELAVELGVMP